MKHWTEGHVHIRMRKALRAEGFTLIAGEYPGGSDHELYPLCVTDPTVARDLSPDPRRHSAGELIPDIVALRGRCLVLGEAKLDYNEPDREKLEYLIGERGTHLGAALVKFAAERDRPELLEIETLDFHPMLIFTDRRAPPAAPAGFSYLILSENGDYRFNGRIGSVGR